MHVKCRLFKDYKDGRQRDDFCRSAGSWRLRRRNPAACEHGCGHRRGQANVVRARIRDCRTPSLGDDGARSKVARRLDGAQTAGSVCAESADSSSL